MYSRKRLEKTYMYRLFWYVKKKIRKREKENLGNIFIFAYFFWLEKSMLCWNNKRIFDPENFWKLLEEIVCFPPFFYCLKKKRLMGRLKNKENWKTSPGFLFPFLLFLRQPISLFFFKNKKMGGTKPGEVFHFFLFLKFSESKTFS